MRLITHILLGFCILYLCKTTQGQDGSTCNQAIFLPLENCSSIITYDNTGIMGTKKGSCNTLGTNNSMWFAFLPSSATANISIQPIGISDPILTVFKSNNSTCANNSLFTEVYCGTVPGQNKLEALLTNLTANEVYFALVDGNGNNTGSFTMCIRSGVQPYNDGICKAIEIPTKNFCSPYGAYSNEGATVDLKIGNNTYYPPCFDNQDLHGVWFQFTASTSYINIAAIGAPNGLKNPQIALLTPPANDCNRTDYWNFTQVACASNGSNNTAILTSTGLTPGQTYYLLVDGRLNGQGFFHLCIKDEETNGIVNDFCNDAIDLCPNQKVSGSTVGATNTNDIPNALWNGCNSETNDMVYYRFGTDATVEDVIIDISYSCTGAKIQLAVFEPTATPCSGNNDNWNNILCVEEGFLPQFQVTVPAASLSPNSTYYVVIDDYPTYECDFELAIRDNAGPNAGFDQQVCATASDFNLSGFSPPGGTWFGPGIINTTSGRFSPSTAGPGNHKLYYQLGNCVDTKTIVVSTAQVSVSDGIEICNGDTGQIFGQAIPLPSNVIRTFENNDAAPLPDNVSNFNSTINVSNINPNMFDAEFGFVSVCVNIVHQRSKDLQLILESPGGTQTMLSNANGSAGFQYLNTCFVEQAGQAINQGGLSSFNGSFAPEESFTNQNGTNVNGTWKLIINDVFSGNSGTFYDWSISFYDKNELNTSITPWSPNNNISDRRVNNPLVYPNSTQTYTYIGVDKINCSTNDQIEVNVVPTEIISINASTTEICEGDSVLISIVAPASKNYDVTLTDGNKNQSFTNLSNGDQLTLYPSTSSDFQLVDASLSGAGTDCVKPDDKVIRITVRPKPSVAYDSIIEACPGDVISLNYTFFPPVPLSFSIDTGNGFINETGFTNNPYQFTIIADTTQSYPVTFISQDNAPFCTASPNEGTLVRVPEKPDISITGDTVFCTSSAGNVTFNINDNELYDLSLSINGNDTLINQVQGSTTISINDADTFNIVVTQLRAVNSGCVFNYQLPWTVIGFHPIQVNVVSDTCYADRSGALIRLQLTGGDSSRYHINGMATDDTFEQFFPAGSTYQFTITDSSACPAIQLNGLVDCSCKSEVGSFNNSPLNICENDTVFLIKPPDRFLEANDSLVFTLSNQSGVILDANFTGQFTFLPGMSTGTPYTLSAVVANYRASFPFYDEQDTCLSSASRSIVFSEKPSVVISGDDTLCFGEQANISLFIQGNPQFDLRYTYQNDTTSLSNLNANYTAQFMPASSGVFKIIDISSANPSCYVISDQEHPIVVIDRPIAQNVNIECANDNETFQVSFDVVGGNPLLYFVDGNSGSFVPAGSRSFVGDPLPSPSNFEYRLENSSGCPIDKVAGFYNCNCTSSPGSMDQQIIDVCEGDSAFGIYDANYVFDANDSLTFILHDSSGFSIGTIFSQSQQPKFGFVPGMSYNTTYYISAVVGNYQPSTIVNFSDSCTVAAPGTPVRFYEKPQLSSINNATICEGDSILIPLSFNQSNEAHRLTYYTANDTGFWIIPSGGNFKLSPDSTTQYYLTNLERLSFPNCQTIVDTSFIIFVNNIPEYTFQYNDSLCEGEQITMVLNINGTAPFNTQISGPNQFSQDFNGLNQFDSIVFVPPSSGSYQFNYLQDGSSSACSNNTAKSFPVFVQPKPSVNIFASDVCEGDTATISLDFTGTAPFSFSIEQSGLSGVSKTFTDVNNDTSISWFANASSLIHIKNFSDNNLLGCSPEIAVVSDSIQVYPKPQINMTYADTICSGDVARIPITLSGTGPFIVNLAMNQKDTTLILQKNDSILQFTPDTTTRYIVSSIVGSGPINCSGSGSDTAFIVVNPSPTGTINGPGSICENDVANMNLAFEGTAPFNFTLSWLNNVIQGNTSHTADIPINLTESSWVRIQQVTDGAHPTCTSILVDSTFIQVNPLPDLNFSAPNAICEESDFVIQVNGTGTAPYRIITTVNGDTTEFENVINSDQLIFQNADSGTYIIHYVLDDALPACSINPDVVFNLAILPKPTADFTSTETEGCSPWEVVFNGLYDDNEVNRVEWRFSDGASSLEKNPAHTFREGKHDVTLTVNGKNGCVTILERENYIEAYPVPEPQFIANPNPVNSLNPTVRFFDQTANGQAVKWTFDSLGVDSTNFPTSFTFPEDKEADYRVCLTAVNQFGCENDICKTIQVIGQLTLLVPSAFTPNGDGVNDLFVPVISGHNAQSYKLRIFNRWGNEIYTTEELNNGWDGTYKGAQSPEGIYTWKIVAKSRFGVERIIQTGMVTLLR